MHLNLNLNISHLIPSHPIPSHPIHLSLCLSVCVCNQAPSSFYTPGFLQCFLDTASDLQHDMSMFSCRACSVPDQMSTQIVKFLFLFVGHASPHVWGFKRLKSMFCWLKPLLLALDPHSSVLKPSFPQRFSWERRI